MNKEFWLERWQAHQLGWHRDDVNPLLIEFWPKLEIKAGLKVFVPLCGKTLDMGYLADERIRSARLRTFLHRGERVLWRGRGCP